MLLILPVLGALVLGLGAVAGRSWTWFFAIALALHLAGLMACLIVLLQGDLAWARAPLRAWPFDAWVFGECALLALTAAAAACGALLRAIRRLWPRPAQGTFGA